eukprot:TRINITY_DN28752_c0_g1_i1.p1 TRINITY_DN28752_c0_g1~~TRINITY_DN28752_c0_g1_i1.p1  ORF type:complete len:235 (+),score=48.77 TRINITY_DN28752_c0_g1_i1:282-986(+)
MSWFGTSQRPSQQSPSIPTQSWYPPSVLSPSTSSIHRSDTSSSPMTSRTNMESRPQSPYSQPSPAAGASIISRLKDKSVDDLKRLLTNKEAYKEVFLSVDQVKDQETLYKELRKETEELARRNLEKESELLELKNQCTVIRTAELAAAQERLQGLERRIREASSFCAPGVLLERLQCAAKSSEEESDDLHQELMDGKIELNCFIQKYKKLRTLYHKRSLLHLAAKCHVYAETVK